jgi:molecular chaperone HtpG
MKEDEYDKYVSFYKALGDVLKEGVSRDWANKEKIADLLLFESMKTEAGKYTTLEKYVEGMPEDQKEIFFLIGETRQQIENSPYLEVFRSRGWDVLLLTDPIDEFVVSSLHEYKGKSLKGVDRGDLDAGKEEDREAAERFKGLLDYLKKALPEVSDVRLSRRLQESASCLVASEGGMTAHMERLMQRMGRENLGDLSKRVLEVNPTHATMTALRELHERSPEDARLETYARLLYDEAVLAEGSKLKDPTLLAKRINELMERDARRAGG